MTPIPDMRILFSGSAVPRRSRRRGFTLVEILVVIGVIAVMLGGIGAVLVGGNQSTALQSGQSTLNALVMSARAQAALEGRNAALLVNYDETDPERYLRYCVVVVRREDNAGWRVVNAGYSLPSGVYVLPPTAPSGSSVVDGVSFGRLRSTGFDGEVRGAFNSNDEQKWLAVGVNPVGLRVNASDASYGADPLVGHVVLTTGTPEPPGSATPVIFNNPYMVRGLEVSRYGVSSLLNERNAINE